MPCQPAETELPPVLRGVPVTPTDRLLARLGLLFVGAVVIFISAVLLLSAHLPDARDPLSEREQAIAGPVLDVAPFCSSTFGRVEEVSVDTSSTPKVIYYRCGWTILGLGGRSQTAQCAQGEWEYGGWMEPQSTGSCSNV